MKKPNRLIKKDCDICKIKFRTRVKNRPFCSQKCFKKWKKINNGERADNEILQDYNLFLDRNNNIRGGKTFTPNHKVNNGKIPWNKGGKDLQKAWNKGLIMKNYYDEEQYKNFINACIKGGVACCLKMANGNERTSIEIVIEEILAKNNIKHFTQYPLLGITVADAYLPDHHIAIYADGDYWHNYPHGTKKDHEVKKELNGINIKVLRFWERDIKKDIKEIENKIIREVQRL